MPPPRQPAHGSPPGAAPSVGATSLGRTVRRGAQRTLNGAAGRARLGFRRGEALVGELEELVQIAAELAPVRPNGSIDASGENRASCRIERCRSELIAGTANERQSLTRLYIPDSGLRSGRDDPAAVGAEAGVFNPSDVTRQNPGRAPDLTTQMRGSLSLSVVTTNRLSGESSADVSRLFPRSSLCPSKPNAKPSPRSSRFAPRRVIRGRNRSGADRVRSLMPVDRVEDVDACILRRGKHFSAVSAVLDAGHRCPDVCEYLQFRDAHVPERVVPSRLVETIVNPRPPNLADVTRCVWPRRTMRSKLVVTFHTRMVLSRLAVAISRPFGLKSTSVRALPWPVSNATCTPSATRQTSAIPSVSPAATRSPVGLRATATIWPKRSATSTIGVGLRPSHTRTSRCPSTVAIRPPSPEIDAAPVSGRSKGPRMPPVLDIDEHGAVLVEDHRELAIPRQLTAGEPTQVGHRGGGLAGTDDASTAVLPMISAAAVVGE